MVDYFEFPVAYNPDTDTLVKDGTFLVYAEGDTSFSTPLTVTDPVSGVTINPLKSSANAGVLPSFRVLGDPERVILKSGSFTTLLTSVLGRQGPAGPSAYEQAVAGGYEGTEEQFKAILAAAPDAITNASIEDGHLIMETAAGDSVDIGELPAGPKGDPGVGIPPVNTGTPGQVLTNLGDAAGWANSAAGIVGAPSTWPSAFPSSPHSHLASEISNATTVGRNLLTAADAQAARAAIGAGTGNGTSNLTLGSASTQAAPGNHTHAASAIAFTPPPGSPITATNMQDAVVQAAATGSGGGTSSVYVWRYQSGAYPTLPSSKPAGVDVVQAYGPVAPTIVPSWVGNGSGQALGRYEYAALT